MKQTEEKIELENWVEVLIVVIILVAFILVWLPHTGRIIREVRAGLET